MKRFWIAIYVATALSSLATAGQPQTALPAETVDFRYSPPWWQTAICLPDDSDKILVGKEGQLLLDYGKGGVRNFAICLQPEVAGPVKWMQQQTALPRAPIVETHKDADGVEMLEEVFVVTPEQARHPSSMRRAVVLVTLKNSGTADAVRQLGLRVQSVALSRFNAGNAPEDAVVLVGSSTRITASSLIESCRPQPDKSFLIRLMPVTLKAGESRQVAFTIDRNSAGRTTALGVEQAYAARDTARQWWEKADLPFEAIQVPDPGIQGMIESCVRNIWQAREIRNSLPAFHVGPTCYRGLWVVDGSFLLEAAAIVGRGKDARAGIEYLLSHQKSDGSFEIMRQYWKENGIVLWAATRHAFLTQDKQWLRQRWPALERVVKVIQTKRLQTSKDSKALDYRLLPAGVIDGGIWNGDGPKSERAKPEFSNDYWCLAGLKAAVAAAHWLGDETNAETWQKEYDDFYATFRKAADRDMLKDKLGNSYVPVMMANADRQSPQKGQWVFCHALYPGQIFPAGDPLAKSQMAMLRATKVQGMVFDTGWMHDGIWTYFASFYGHAALWQGNGQEAAEVLYSFANHACPTRVWREEQKPVGKGSEEVGDMPHNWASAEFIRLAAHLLEIDRGRELHLFEGLPRVWTGKGLVTRLNDVATPFGPLTLELKIAADGRTAHLRVEPLPDPSCTKIVVHLTGWALETSGAVKELSPAKRNEVDIPLLHAETLK